MTGPRPKKKREPVGDEEVTPGYVQRQEELAEVEDAGGSLNRETRDLVKQRERNLERQENIIKLRRKKKVGE